MHRVRRSAAARRRGASCGASGARSGPAGNTLPLPKPRRASITSSERSLYSDGSLKAVIHHDDGGALRLRGGGARDTVARETIVGAARASSSGSSPTSADLCALASTRTGPAR